MKIRELLTDESKWCKGRAHDESGAICLLEAIELCYRQEGYTGATANLVRQAIGVQAITDWNDAPERTFAEVKALVERLDI